MSNLEDIFFFWEGGISESRLKILTDCLYSTRVFNPTRNIRLVSNSIEREQLDPAYNIQILNWSDNIFNDLPLDKQYIMQHYANTGARELSDLMRLVLLYKYGGSYVDTDDLAIKQMPDTKNIICRSYDPHTSFYNKKYDADCIEGKHREIRGYDHIPMFPRNDCWLNFEPKSKFITDMLSNPLITTNDKAIYIGDDFSWQSLTLDTIQKNIGEIGYDFNFGLTLLYLFEDFVSASSFWDRCHHGGEMCDLWKEMPGVMDVEWGFYKTDRNTANSFLNKVVDTYPYLSHMWLHSKDMKQEWLLPELTEELYSPSTWIYQIVREKIAEWKSFQ